MSLHTKGAEEIPQTVLFEPAPHHQGLFGAKNPVRIYPLDSQQTYRPGDTMRVRILASGRSIDPQSIQLHANVKVQNATNVDGSQDYLESHLSATFDQVRVKLNGTVDVDVIKPYNRLRAAVETVEVSRDYKNGWGSAEGYAKDYGVSGARNPWADAEAVALGYNGYDSQDPAQNYTYVNGSGKESGTGFWKGGTSNRREEIIRMKDLINVGHWSSCPLDMVGFTTVNKLLPLGAFGSIDLEIQLADAASIMKSGYTFTKDQNDLLTVTSTNFIADQVDHNMIGSYFGVPARVTNVATSEILFHEDGKSGTQQAAYPGFFTLDLQAIYQATGTVETPPLMAPHKISGLPPGWTWDLYTTAADLLNIQVFPSTINSEQFKKPGQVGSWLANGSGSAFQFGFSGYAGGYAANAAKLEYIFGKTPSSTLTYVLDTPYVTLDTVTFNDRYNSAINTRLDRGLTIEYDTYTLYSKTFAAGSGMKEMKVVRTLQSLKSILWWFVPVNEGGRQGVTYNKHKDLLHTFPLLGVKDFQIYVNNRPILSHPLVIEKDRKSEVLKSLQKAFKLGDDLDQVESVMSEKGLANYALNSSDLNVYGQQNIFSYDHEKSDMRSGQYINEIMVQMQSSNSALENLAGTMYMALHYDARLIAQSGRVFTLIQ